MSEEKRDIRKTVLAVVAAVLLLGGLWVACFMATGLMWWSAPDPYGTTIERPEAIAPPGSLEQAYERHLTEADDE